MTVANHGNMQLRVLGNPVASSPAQPANAAFDPACFDFTAYLSRRLGVDSTLTTELLGQWLKAYKRSPQLMPLTESPQQAPRAKRPSGVYSLAECGEERSRRTGTDA